MGSPGVYPGAEAVGRDKAPGAVAIKKPAYFTRATLIILLFFVFVADQESKSPERKKDNQNKTYR